MILHVTKAEYRGDFRIWLSFNDGASGEVDLAGKLTGSMFEPLADRKVFARFHVDEELGTIVWDNGADLAPEYLQDLVNPDSTVSRTPAKAPSKVQSSAKLKFRAHRKTQNPVER